MKKLLFILLFFAAATQVDAQITHRFQVVGFNAGVPSLSADSLTYSIPVQVVTVEKLIALQYPGKFEQVDSYTFVVSASKNAKQIGAIMRDSVRAFSNRKYPNF